MSIRLAGRGGEPVERRLRGPCLWTGVSGCSTTTLGCWVNGLYMDEGNLKVAYDEAEVLQHYPVL